MRRKKSARDERVGEVQRWFKKSVTYEGEAYVIDSEQAAAVIDESLNTIVVARAGSGKTRTIVAKIVYLVARCGVEPEEIMTFVFNANAAKEINERLGKMQVDGEPVIEGKVKIASTFHAFSRKIVYDVCDGRERCGKILAGEKEEMVTAIVEKMLREPRWADEIQQFIGGGVIKVEDECATDINGVGQSRERRVEEQDLVRFARMMTSFINRAQQKYLAGENTLKKDMRERLKSEEVGQRERAFVELGVECYRRYHRYILKRKLQGFSEYGTDFNLLVSWASKLIGAKRGKVRKLLANKKYILIDEYQDFSQLFLSVVLALRKVTPGVRLFVVGDDWQAINRFAGSEVEYFKEFERYFPSGSRRYEITTNYRCNYEVVDSARKFMKKAMGEKGNFKAFSKRAGRVVLVDAKATKKRYLEILVKLLRENKKAKDILILHRNNDTHLKISLEGLEKALKREVVRAKVMTAEDFGTRVRVITMHKSKGLEAEVVIILETDDGVIPKTHPDTLLYTVFGETEEVSRCDQVRLFYVAMTRAKKRLYIMHEKMPQRKLEGFIPYLGRGMEWWEE